MRESYALSLAIGIHEFLELCGSLDLEEDLFTVLYLAAGT